MALGHTQLLYKGREQFPDPLKGATFHFPYNLRLPQWEGRAVILLSYTPLLLFCKRGLDSCREQRRWERKESSWDYSLNRQGSIQPNFLNHPGLFSSLNSSFHIGHLSQALPPASPTRITSTVISRWLRLQFWWTYGPQKKSTEHQRTLMIQMLILLFICEEKKFTMFVYYVRICYFVFSLFTSFWSRRNEKNATKVTTAHYDCHDHLYVQQLHSHQKGHPLVSSGGHPHHCPHYLNPCHPHYLNPRRHSISFSWFWEPSESPLWSPMRHHHYLSVQTEQHSPFWHFLPISTPQNITTYHQDCCYKWWSR